MAVYSVTEAAGLLSVSDDTVRRWIDAGRLHGRPGPGRTLIDGAELARLAQQLADDPDRSARGSHVSARNRLVGIVTSVRKDGVMAQVDLICGPFRMVSLMSAEAADDLGLEPGSRAVASVKATNVVVETP